MDTFPNTRRDLSALLTAHYKFNKVSHFILKKLPHWPWVGKKITEDKNVMIIQKCKVLKLDRKYVNTLWWNEDVGAKYSLDISEDGEIERQGI